MSRNAISLAVGLCLLVGSSVWAGGSAEAGTTPEKRGVDNIQVDFRIAIKDGAHATNYSFSVCVREGTSFNAKDVTSVSYVEKVGADKGAIKFIEVGTNISVRADTLDGIDGIRVAATLEQSEIVWTSKDGVPVVRKNYMDFTTTHKNAAVVRVLSADSVGSDSGRAVAVYVRAFKAMEGPKPGPQPAKRP